MQIVLEKSLYQSDAKSKLSVLQPLGYQQIWQAFPARS